VLATVVSKVTQHYGMVGICIPWAGRAKERAEEKENERAEE
jgi:hypothetical protein